MNGHNPYGDWVSAVVKNNPAFYLSDIPTTDFHQWDYMIWMNNATSGSWRDIIARNNP